MVTIQWQNVKLSDVIRFYTEGFKSTDGRITEVEYWIDTAKGEVVFKLYTSTEE